MANNIIPDDLITTINDFKKSLNGQTISIHGKDYATVALRLAVARRNLGAKLKIETEIVSIDKDTVVCKATVSVAGNVIATGLAEEKRSASRINQTSALENCETSAVGRALAFAGFGGGYSIASKEEVDNAKAAQTKSHVKIKQLEELDKLSKDAEPFIGKEQLLKYKKQRQDGYFDTLVRVNACKDYFQTQIKEGSNDGKADK